LSARLARRFACKGMLRDPDEFAETALWLMQQKIGRRAGRRGRRGTCGADAG